MKTTLELDDALLIEAKSVAAQRRTTLRALVEHALRRELRPSAELANLNPDKFAIGPLGLPVLKRHPGQKPTTLEDLRRIEQEMEDEEFHRIAMRRPSKRAGRAK
jgi:hypothetical protein